MAKKNSWDRLEPLNVGDEKPEDIFINVGMALSQFEELQLRLRHGHVARSSEGLPG